MKRLFSVLSLLAIASIIVSLAHSNSSFADSATSQNITVSPSSTQLTVFPGETIKRSFVVLNSGSSAYNIDTSISPYHVEGENYDPQFTQLAGTTSPVSWVTLLNSHMSIQAGKSVAVAYTVTVPKNAAPGGYYAVIFAQTSPITPSKNGVVPHNRVGNILYITVQGPVKMGGTVTPVSLGHLLFQTDVPVGLKVSNTGGVHFVSTTTISIKDIFGRQVYSASLERYILPQTQRLISIDWQPTAPIGLYHVSRSATVAGATQTLPSHWMIVVHPWFMVWIVFIVVVVVLYLLARRRINHSARNASK